jgi:hypothetical protein
LVAVIGPSGSGKSSVVQAGLLPLLRRERNPYWDVLIFTPGQSPWHNLAAAFIANWMPDDDPVKRFIQAEELGERLKKEGAIGRAIGQTLQSSRLTDRDYLLVVERLLDHVEEQLGHLPLLEFALTELWLRRQGWMLRHQQYSDIGEVEGAISKRAEEQFAKLSPEQQAIALL